MSGAKAMGMAWAALAALGLITVPASARDAGRRHGHVVRARRPIERSQRYRRSLEWSGSVDDVTDIVVSRSGVREDRLSGKRTENVRRRVTGPLPRRPARLRLRNVEGRGEVWIVQQPSVRDDYTARVRIRDKAPGRGHYRFMLVW